MVKILINESTKKLLLDENTEDLTDDELLERAKNSKKVIVEYKNSGEIKIKQVLNG